MPSRNKVCFVGHLAEDPSLLYSATGRPYTRFRMGCTTGRDEARKTEWVSCVAFGDLAELIAGLAKGTSLHVEGRQQTQEWTDANAIKRWSVSCVVDYAALPLYKPKSGQDVRQRSARAQEDTDDIPF